MPQARPKDPAGTPKLPWRRSLRTRLMLWSSLTSVLLLAGVALTFFLTLRVVLVDKAEDEVRELAGQTARGLQATLESVQVSAQALAGGAAGLGRAPANLTHLMKSTLDADPAIAGVMLIIEPGRLTADDPGFDWYVRRDPDGLFESAVRALGPEYADYRVFPWWIRTVTSTRGWWSEPYANAATDGEAFITYNLPLRRPGDGPGAEPVGMVSVDVPVRRLRDVLGRAGANPRFRQMLLSPELGLAIHHEPEVEALGRLAAVIEGGRGDLAPLAEHVAARRGPLELRHVVAPGNAHAGDVRYTFAEPVGATGFTYVLSVDEGWILAELTRITLWGVIGGLVGVALCVAVVRRYSGLIARPIEDLTDSAGHFAQGEFDYPLAHVGRDDEVGVMARAFDAARGSIKRQMAEIAEMGAARQRLESELDIARDIQQAMLPPPGELRGGGRVLAYRGHVEPAKAVGGDFYNLFDREREALWFVIGDVSDKGVPAALFMARTMTVLEVAAQLGGSPGKALAEAARHLVEGNDTCMFATVLCGVVELRSGALQLANAGHEPPVLLRADGTRALLDVPGAGPLGVDVADDYPVWRGTMAPGDTLLLYTDGVTEAFDVHDAAFGIERALAVLDPARDPAAQIDALVAAVHAFAADAPQSDDITVLAIRYIGDPA